MDLNFCFEYTSVQFENFDVFVNFQGTKLQSTCTCNISKVCVILFFDLVLGPTWLIVLIFIDSLYLTILDSGDHILQYS